MSREILNRKAIFVMGHYEVQAATITLNAGYHKYSRREQKVRRELGEILG